MVLLGGDKMIKIREYAEIVKLIQEYSEKEGLSYSEALDLAKEKLLSDRAATHSSDNNKTHRKDF